MTTTNAQAALRGQLYDLWRGMTAAKQAHRRASFMVRAGISPVLHRTAEGVVEFRRLNESLNYSDAVFLRIMRKKTAAWAEAQAEFACLPAQAGEGRKAVLPPTGEGFRPGSPGNDDGESRR